MEEKVRKCIKVDKGDYARIIVAVSIVLRSLFVAALLALLAHEARHLLRLLLFL